MKCFFRHLLFTIIPSWGFVEVGGDKFVLREDRTGDECQDYYDNCFYKKDGELYSIHNDGKGKRGLRRCYKEKKTCWPPERNYFLSGDAATSEGSELGYCFGWTKDCDACKSGPTEENCLIYRFVEHGCPLEYYRDVSEVTSSSDTAGLWNRCVIGRTISRWPAKQRMVCKTLSPSFLTLWYGISWELGRKWWK